MSMWAERCPWLPRAFAARLERELGLPLSELPLPAESLHPLDERAAHESVFFGTQAAREHCALTEADLDWFMTQAPQGYAALGFWGHGVNSYAFYYTRVDAWSRVFVRLPFGGVYMDNQEASARIGRYLPALFEFERRIQATTTSWRVIESMGAGRYLRQSGSRSWALREALSPHPDPLLLLEESLL